MSVQQNLTAALQDPAQVLRLATEIEEIQAEYDKRVADLTEEHNELTRKQAPVAVAAAHPGVPAPVAPEPQPASRPQRPDSRTEVATLRLRSELDQLESVLQRTDGARIELAVSQAAFKYRYSVIRPAQIPREPVAPNFRLLILAGIVSSLMLAVAAAVATDLLSNRILEAWQVERQLGLPVLGTLRTI